MAHHEKEKHEDGHDGHKAGHLGGKHHGGKHGMGKKEVGFGAKLKHHMGKATHLEGPHGKK